MEYRYTGNLWNWFDCYLKTGLSVSLWKTIYQTLYLRLPISLEYPQGSILGPLLFLVFTNDLPTVITSQLFDFADDTKCFRQITSTADINHLQEDLNSISNWSINNLLSFNLPKFIFMSLHRKFTSKYVINSHTIY